MIERSGNTLMSHARPSQRVVFGLLLAAVGAPSIASADPMPSTALRRVARDGVYDRFDGDLDLGVAVGVDVGSAGRPAPLIRGTAHYFSIAGIYVSGRVHSGQSASPSLFGAGVDLRPLFVPRWAKGFESGPRFADLALDSLSLSLGAFWQGRSRATSRAGRGFEAQLGFGLPLLAKGAGPWLEIRGALRYPDDGSREEAVLLLLAFHGFVTTPFSAPP